VVARSKAWVCGRPPAEIIGSNPTGSSDCCVLSGRGLCDKLTTLPGESYQMWCVVVFDLETSWMRRSWPNGDFRAKNKTNDRLNTPTANAAKRCGCLQQLSFGVKQIQTDFSRHCKLLNNSANCLPQPIQSNDNNRSVNKYTTLYEPER